MPQLIIEVPEKTLKKLRDKGLQPKDIDNIIAHDLEIHAELTTEKLAKDMPRPGHRQEATA